MGATTAPKRPRRKRAKTDDLAAIEARINALDDGLPVDDDEANLVDMMAESDALDAAMETLPSWSKPERDPVLHGQPLLFSHEILPESDALNLAEQTWVDEFNRAEANMNAADAAITAKFLDEARYGVYGDIVRRNAEDVEGITPDVPPQVEFSDHVPDDDLALAVVPAVPPQVELSDYVPDDMVGAEEDLALVPSTNGSVGTPGDKRIALIQQWTNEALKLAEKAEDSKLNKHERERVHVILGHEFDAKQGLESGMFAQEVINALREFVNSVEYLKFVYNEELDDGDDDDDDITPEQALAHPDVRAEIEAAVTKEAMKQAAALEEEGAAKEEEERAANSEDVETTTTFDYDAPLYLEFPTYTGRDIVGIMNWLEVLDDYRKSGIMSDDEWEEEFDKVSQRALEMYLDFKDFLNELDSNGVELAPSPQRVLLMNFMDVCRRFFEDGEVDKVDVSDMVKQAAINSEEARNVSALVNEHETVDEVADVTGNELNKRVEEMLVGKEGDDGTDDSDDADTADVADKPVTQVVELNPNVPAVAQTQVDAATVLPTQAEQDALNEQDKVADRIKQVNGEQEGRVKEIDLNVVVPPNFITGAHERNAARTAQEWVRQVVKYIYDAKGFIHDREDYVEDLEDMAVTIKTANGVIAKKIPKSKARTYMLVDHFLTSMPNNDMVRLAKELYARLRDGGNGARDVQSVYTWIRAFIYHTLNLGPITSTFITHAPEVEAPYILALESYQKMKSDPSVKRARLNKFKEKLLRKGPGYFNVHEYGFGRF